MTVCRLPVFLIFAKIFIGLPGTLHAEGGLPDIPEGHVPNGELYGRLFSEDRAGRCPTRCCQERRKLLYYHRAQGLIASPRGDGRRLADLKREFNETGIKLSFLENINSLRRDYVDAVEGFKKLPRATDGVVLPMKRRLLVDALVESVIAKPDEFPLHLLAGDGSTDAFAPLREHFRCPDSGGGMLCEVLATEDADERRTLQGEIRRFVNGHRAAQGEDVPPESLGGLFEIYKGELNYRFPENLESASGKGALLERIDGGLRGADADVPEDFSKLKNAQCRTARQRLGALQGRKGRRAVRRGVYRSLINRFCPGPELPNAGEIADLKAYLAELGARIREIMGSREYADLDDYKKDSLEKVGSACDRAAGDMEDGCGSFHLDFQRLATSPIDAASFESNTGILFAEILPGVSPNSDLAFLRESADGGVDRALEESAEADPNAAAADAPIAGPETRPIILSYDGSGEVLDSDRFSRETPLVMVTNDHGRYEFYEMVVEITDDNTLRQLHFDSYDRDTMEYKERKKSLPIGSFEETLLYEGPMGIDVFRLEPRNFNSIDGGYFTFHYMHRLALPRKFKSVELGIVKQDEQWVMVDGTGRRLAGMHVIVQKPRWFDKIGGHGMKEFVLEYDDNEGDIYAN